MQCQDTKNLSKVLKPSKKPLKCAGFTLLELIISISVILILIGLLVKFVAPADTRSRARDTKRLNAISTLDRAITEYMLDHGELPGTANTSFTSNSLPTGQVGPYENVATGWIDEDLSDYTSKLPIDPTNDATYHFTYLHNDTEYEINAVLEFFTEKMTDDGGDDDSFYEVGNSLDLL